MHKYGSRASLPNSHTQLTVLVKFELFGLALKTLQLRQNADDVWRNQRAESGHARDPSDLWRGEIMWRSSFFAFPLTFFLVLFFYSRFALEQKGFRKSVQSTWVYVICLAKCIASWLYGFSLRSECQRFSLRWTEDSENVSIQNRSSPTYVQKRSDGPEPLTYLSGWVGPETAV